MKWHKEHFWISDDLADADMAAVQRLLSTTYWASARPPERTERSVRGSVCFSLKRDAEQIGFARVLTDDGCYAVVVDVVIDARFRRRGLGHWLMSVITAHVRFEGMVLVLWTADQVKFYEACGLSCVTEFHVLRKAPQWLTGESNQATEAKSLP